MDSEDTVRTAERKHYTVLWTFDANTATPLSRTRLNTATTDLASGLAIIHAEAGKLSIHPPPDGAIATPNIPSTAPAASKCPAAGSACSMMPKPLCSATKCSSTPTSSAPPPASSGVASTTSSPT